MSKTYRSTERNRRRFSDDVNGQLGHMTGWAYSPEQRARSRRRISKTDRAYAANFQQLFGDG